ncbi:hydrogenase formation protein HypD [Desulfurivibrio alkaliphilus]|uniref:hydrogenase formation protein HypD n=1 Tax=Desulfurivibrio alkaliphilus TaxID=427923 RepID=UPI0005A2FC5E
MKHLDEYRDPALARKLLAEIAAVTTRPWVIMEICGGHTHAIIRHGIDLLLPRQLELVHGPGCPVCVTPVALIDQALALARRPEVIFTSFGDMLRVPGSRESLARIRARGGDIRTVYSPLEAVNLAVQNPAQEVVFFAVGFETTAPGNALAVQQAARLGLTNFSLLVSHVLVPPAIGALLAAPDNRIQAFLAPGHVCTVEGLQDYEAMAAAHQVPMVPAGFEPVDILAAILLLVRQLEEGRAQVENEYRRSVRPEGNPAARLAVEQVFQVCHRTWRGLGEIPASGLRLRPEFAAFDAQCKFALEETGEMESPQCISGAILRGESKPPQCPAFGKECTPEHPLGATMVSSEGACAAYRHANRQ